MEQYQTNVHQSEKFVSPDSVFMGPEILEIDEYLTQVSVGSSGKIIRRQKSQKKLIFSGQSS